MGWWKNLWNSPPADKTDGYVHPEPREGDPWREAALVKAMEERVSSFRADSSDYRDEQEAFDGFKNELTGVGDFTRDKTFGGRAGGPDFLLYIMPRYELEKRWRGSDLGGRIVETVPDEMVREGFDITIQPADGEEDEGEEKEKPIDTTAVEDAFPPNAAAATHPGAMLIPPPEKPEAPLPDVDQESQQQVEDINDKLDELDAVESKHLAMCYGRCYGGGAILMGIQDGMRLEQPVNEEAIESVDWLHVFTGGWDGEMVAWSYYSDIKSPKYGKPEIYMLRNLRIPYSVPIPGVPAPRPTQVNAITWVHESRVLTFGPKPTSMDTCIQNRGWGDSLFVRIDRVLSQFDQTWGGVANIMTDFSQAILKIKDLGTMMGAKGNAGGTGLLATRARGINLTRSISNILMIDMDEEFKRDTASLTGMEGVLQQMALRMAGAADMSVSELFGQAPAGLNATGDSEYRYHCDKVAARIRRELRPEDRRLIRYIMLSKDGPTGGKVPERWNINYRSLYQLTELQKADLRLKCSQADASDITAGILNPAEVTVSAYGGSEYSTDRTVDFEGRAKMAVEEAKAKEEHAKALMEAAKNPPSVDPNAPPGKPAPFAPKPEPKE